MATLERIRRRSGLLIIVIGVAMLGFILTDFLSSGNSIFRADATVVGKVNGRTVELNEFSDMMDEREQLLREQNPQQAQMITRKQLADAVWDEIVREQLMAEQYDELGISVSSDELYERVKMNPNIRQAQLFQDQTGNFSEARLQQYIRNLREDKDFEEEARQQYSQWVNFEKSIKQNALQTKYNKLIEAGIYVPTPIVKKMYANGNTQVSGQFIVEEYSKIPDAEVTVEDSDLRDYYSRHKEDYKTDALADIQYVNFNIEASAEDRQALQGELNGYRSGEVVTDRQGKTDTLESFANASKDSLFAASRSDLRVIPDYYKKGNLPAGLDSSIFEHEVGYVTEPYEAEGFYRISKIADKKNLPDSVKARHILLSFQGVQGSESQRTFQEAKKLADSLAGVIREDSSQFAALARQYSEDPGSGAKGGDLGWFDDQSMVRPFSNFAFRHKSGKVGVVLSRFGYHIIQVLDQKGSVPAVKLISISREINATDNTVNSIYNAASEFAASVNNMEEFAAKAEEKGYRPRPVTGLKPFDENIPGLGNNREMVKWAHNEENEVGDIQLLNNQNNSYVVVVLTDRAEEGYRSFESVKEKIRPDVIKEKKAQMLKEKINKAMQGADGIVQLGQKLSTNINSFNSKFSNNVLNAFGNEPAVVGVITALEPNKMSKPVEGNRGVYVVQVQNRNNAPELPDYSAQMQQQKQQVTARISRQIYPSLKEEADIDDRRAKFY